MRGLELGLGELRERIALCEDSLRFNKEKHSALMSKKLGGFDPDSRVIYQSRYQQPLYALALIRCLFSAMRNFLFENYSLLTQQQQLLKQLQAEQEHSRSLREQTLTLTTQYHS